MIQPFLALVSVEVFFTLTLLFRTPLRKPMVMLLDRMKRGQGPVVAKTVAATLFMILVSILYNIMKVQKRSAESGHINPPDQILLLNHILEACLLGFTLFLAMMIDRLHYYMKELRTLRKKQEETNKSKD
ncbi:OLC1v1036063C1 [Oldenlandia corymbosa var. corymbosa]|uniref:Endoplasmic reticulum transmembrane protein n=1 Tax=Oldenlandia corymbosa var. corymbosa TaxID=529605 RepID=A0AAV1CV32_OLDCO|nr:OLC1v1036063C1 [Oldenlandia corymbosa var. corymbosa]